MKIDFNLCPICKLDLIIVDDGELSCPSSPRHFFQNIRLNRLEVDFDVYCINYYSDGTFNVWVNSKEYCITDLPMDLKNLDKDSFVKKLKTMIFYS
jgi:hypothetical protein